MSFKDQVVNFILQGKDLFSSVANKSEKAMLDLAAQSEKLNAQLDDIRKQQEAINTLDDLTVAVEKGKRAYADSTQALQHLQDEQKAAAKYAKELSAQQAEAASKSSQLEQDYQKLTTELTQYDAQVLATKDRIAQLSAEQTSGATASEQQAAAIAAAKSDLLKLEQAQTDTRTSADKLSTELEQQRQALDGISTESDKASRTSAEYAAKVKLARGELSTLGTVLNKNQRTLSEQKAVLDKAGISAENMADASAKLKQQEAAAEGAIKDVNTRLQKHQKLLDESKKGANDFGGSIKSATASLLAMAGAYIGVDRLWESLKSILTTGDRFAAFNAQMTAMMGSVAAGEQATAWIKDFANNTGSKLESVQTAFAKLKAFGIDPMNGSLQAMTDYNAKLGGSQQDLEGIILAVGQAWAKQKLQGEEILQLVERGVPVWGLLEQATGKNAVQLAKLSQAGKLGQETIKALVDEMGKAADGQAALSLDRLGGQINVLSNNWDVFKNKVADAGLYKTAIDFLKQLNDKFDEMNANGKLKQLASDISNFFTTIINDGGNSLQKLLDNISAFTKGLSIVGNTIKIFWNGLTAGVSVFAAAVTQQFANIAGSFSTLLATVGADKLSAKLRETQNVLNALSDAYKQQVIQDGADIREAWDSINSALSDGSKKTYKDIGDAADESAKRRVDAEKTVGDTAEEQAQRRIQSLKAQADAADQNAKAAQEAFKKGEISAQDYAVALEAARSAAKALKDATSNAADDVKNYELAMAKAGITTKKVYEEQAATAKETYQQVKDSMAKGIASINEQEQAYLKWAEAEVKAAAASKQHVDAYVYQQAAALGLKTELQDLINTNYDAEKSYAALALQLDETTKATDNLNQSQKSTADAVSQATAALDEQSAALTQVTQNITIFGSEQQSLTDQLDFSGKSVETLEARYRELGDAMATNIQVSSAWWKEAGKSASDGIAIERSLIVQTLRYRKLAQQISSGTMSLADLDRATKTVNNSFRDLDSQMLDNLRSAISDARSEMLALRDDLKTTQAELQDELDQLQGKQKDQELETLKQRQAELNQQLAEAKAAGDKEAIAAAEKSLQLAKQIYDTKKRQADLEAQAAKTQAAANTATNTSNTSTATSTTAPPTTTTTVASSSAMTATLYLVINNKPQAVTTTQTDLNSLMAAINQAKLSSGG
ncbi:tape measure protein [Shewanella sp. A32]|uniref:tape measure protein n=1 Tax=Shewanella sp. A32 TaxID=3031327 RepID=UPI0023B9D376|nr:tape measure protein [Shewanella sp. A32]MDF0533667.1 tape measure protein [Shewanella sp. A32]